MALDQCGQFDVSLWVNDCSKLYDEGALNENSKITALSFYYHKSQLEFKSNVSVWFSRGEIQ